MYPVSAAGRELDTPKFNRIFSNLTFTDEMEPV